MRRTAAENAEKCRVRKERWKYDGYEGLLCDLCEPSVNFAVSNKKHLGEKACREQ